jgi:hypothetical protein
LNIKYCLYLPRMKSSKKINGFKKQRITLLLAVLFCLFISSVEYYPQAEGVTKTEQQSDHPGQTVVKLAVDAVVPFALHVVHTSFYLIYQIFSFEIKLPSLQVVDASIPISWVEILFERIISTKGP